MIPITHGVTYHDTNIIITFVPMAKLSSRSLTLSSTDNYLSTSTSIIAKYFWRAVAVDSPQASFTPAEKP